MTIPKIHPLDVRKQYSSAEHREPLLSSSNSEDDGPAIGPLPSQHRLPSITRPQAQSGFPRTPRTPNRVRFNLEDLRRSSEHDSREGSDGLEEEQENDYDSIRSPNNSARFTAQRAPLLTGIEAPSVTFANLDSGADAAHEFFEINSRPKSGMTSAFMNMANSIM